MIRKRWPLRGAGPAKPLEQSGLGWPLGGEFVTVTFCPAVNFFGPVRPQRPAATDFKIVVMELRSVASRLPLLFFFALSSLTRADTAAFDLTGPPVDVRVKRGDKTLPISEVPNLQPGDRLWIHPALPSNQSVRYLLIAAFLRGATNPPPEDWFVRAETWNRKVRQEGIFVVVPPGAEQAVIFLAPETTGDFSTLRSAVRGRPGSFVRAIQDLEQASLDRSRLDAYLSAMYQTAEADPAAVHEKSMLLARSLNIRLDEDCFKKPVDQQAGCLTQRSENLVLNDGHSQSMVGVLTQGPASDLIGQIATTPKMGSGYYSPYVGAIIDMGRILDSLHTAQYQYIPALALPKQDQLQLKLNSPPSFHNPKSVIVIALPAVNGEKPPPLHAADPQQVYCLQSKPLVLQAAGAPLAFSTALLHDMTLHIERKGAAAIDLPARADALRGGYVIDTKPLAEASIDQNPMEGVLRGYWGFDSFTGPSFKLQSAHSVKWGIPAAETASLVAGREHTFHLHGDAAACVDQVSIKSSDGNTSKATWKMTKADELEVKIAAGSAAPGKLQMLVRQTGVPHPDELEAIFYAETGHLDRFEIIPGEAAAKLHGSHLEEVASVEVNGVRFTPAAPPRDGEMPLTAERANATGSFKPESKASGHAILKDGRKLEVPAIIEAPPPSVVLLGKRVDLGSESAASAIHLTNPDELPLDGHLSFSLKSRSPNIFPREEKIEIAAADDSVHATLTIANGGLTLQDASTVLAEFSPAKAFGGSAFGPLRFRPVDERGVAGDWQPLATLVRVPFLKELRCPEDPAQPCVLNGTNLFLIDSVAADPQFTVAVSVPEGFVDSVLSVPHPAGPTLYLKLRDDPKDINTATVAPAQDKLAGQRE